MRGGRLRRLHPPGHIALIQRGTCTFAVKAVNAEAAGAAGVIIFNQGNTAAADRQELIVGTLGGPDVVGIPVVGRELRAGCRARRRPARPRRSSCPQPEQRPQKNVIAELPGVNDDNVVMAGAHLDSVQAGPGHQRQRLRLGVAARDRAEHGEEQAAEHRALRLVGRGGGRPDRLDRVRRRA